MVRGKGVAMAQLVNIVGFSVGKLGQGDLVIVHGTENIDDRVKKYITTQFEHLQDRGGRVMYSYNDVKKMVADHEFNQFDAADYTILGPMLDGHVQTYQNILHQQLPPDLAQLVTRKNEDLAFLRRGLTNVVFQMDLALGVNPNREAQRRKVEMDAKRAEEAARMDQLMTGKVVRGAKLTSVRGDAEQSRNAHSDDGKGEDIGSYLTPRVKRSREREKKMKERIEKKRREEEGIR
jgi:hypothetical protein